MYIHVQLKTVSAAGRPTAGLFTYPVLQAADVLLYKYVTLDSVNDLLLNCFCIDTTLYLVHGPSLCLCLCDRLMSVSVCVSMCVRGH